MMKKATAAALAAVVVGTGSLTWLPNATAEVAGNIAIGTDYRFRGISQTDRDPAISGGFDLTTESGFYLGTWASNVAFGSSIEMDYYGGYRGAINDDLGFDVGVLYYNYPSDNADPDLDYIEFAGALTWGGAKVGLNYSDDYFAETDQYFYLYGSYSMNITEEVTLSGTLGYNSFDSEEALASFLVTEDDPGDDYIDWKITLGVAAFDLNWSLSYVDTNLDEDDCGGTQLCDGTVVAAVSKSL